MLMSREQILAQRLATERCKIPWLNGAESSEIIVRAMSARVIEGLQNKEHKFGSDVYVFVNSVVDENGKRLYTDEDQQLIAETIESGLIQYVWSIAWRLSELSAERKAAIKKNLPTTLGAALFGESASASDTPTPT